MGEDGWEDDDCVRCIDGKDHILNMKTHFANFNKSTLKMPNISLGILRINIGTPLLCISSIISRTKFLDGGHSKVLIFCDETLRRGDNSGQDFFSEKVDISTSSDAFELVVNNEETRESYTLGPITEIITTTKIGTVYLI